MPLKRIPDLDRVFRLKNQQGVYYILLLCLGSGLVCLATEVGWSKRKSLSRRFKKLTAAVFGVLKFWFRQLNLNYWIRKPNVKAWFGKLNPKSWFRKP